MNSLKKRIVRLAELRDAEGYMVKWEAEGRRFRFIENYCLISINTAPNYGFIQLMMCF